MKSPGHGMTMFDEQTTLHADAKEIVEYELKTFDQVLQMHLYLAW
jgi:hypothetical protein